MDNELCVAGKLLAQRMEIGINNLQTGTVEVKAACNQVVQSLQDIRDTTTALHTRMGDIERRANLNDTKTNELGEKIEGHVGLHMGAERAGAETGRKYGIVYGIISAALTSIATYAALLQAFTMSMP